MQLTSITLENIRSIASMQQDFPPGTMLFFGDVGSGKSSVLKAIEFALFGILDAGDLGGESLLRRGEKRGFVELSFSIDGHDYTVRRDIEKTAGKGKAKGSETINQGKKGFLISDGVKTPYSAKELRVEILKILGYSVIRYQNAKSIPLFRYTVYTPQEQVKEILWEPAEARFGILKEVFDIVKYETALANVKAADDGLRLKVDAADRQLASIGNPEAEIPDKQEAIAAQERTLESTSGALGEARSTRDGLAAARDAAQADVTGYTVQANAIASKQVAIDAATKKIRANQSKLTDAIAALETMTTQIAEVPQPGDEPAVIEAQAEEQLKAARASLLEAKTRSASISVSISNVSSLLETGQCSLCGQTIHERERFDAELAQAQQDLADAEATITQLEAEIFTLEDTKKAARTYAEITVKLDSLTSLLAEKQRSRDAIMSAIVDLEQEISTTNAEIAAVLEQYAIADIDAFRAQGAELEQALAARKNELSAGEAEVMRLERVESAGQQALAQLRTDLATLEANVALKADLERKIGHTKDVRAWLTGSFPALVRDIERELLASTAQQFNDHFREWFKLLVEEETIDVEIDPANFQPVVRVNGHDSPPEDLSGGEKSALALAYRLALDKVIVEKYPDVKTRDLLILDEPTDGFSAEQVNRMQVVFERLGMHQMIIISHERTLDSFVDETFTFSKTNHETKIKKE
jgi:exonuclease SbcC